MKNKAQLSLDYLDEISKHHTNSQRIHKETLQQLIDIQLDVDDISYLGNIFMVIHDIFKDNPLAAKKYLDLYSMEDSKKMNDIADKLVIQKEFFEK